MAMSSLGLFGVVSLCDSAMGATERRQRLGLIAGVVAALTFVYFDLSIGRLSERSEPSYWPLSPIAIATYLLLESYWNESRKSRDSPATE